MPGRAPGCSEKVRADGFPSHRAMYWPVLVEPAMKVSVLKPMIAGPEIDRLAGALRVQVTLCSVPGRRPGLPWNAPVPSANKAYL